MPHRHGKRDGRDTAGTDWADPQDARPIDMVRSAKNVSCDAASMHKTILVDASRGARYERQGRGARDEGEVPEARARGE